MILTTDVTGAPVYAYVINDIEITNAYMSECGRFDVTPDYYGLTQVMAEKLRDMNTYIASMVDEIITDSELFACTSFSQLHDYCDANVLGDIDSREFANTEEMIDFANTGMDAIDAWLKGRTK
jgi:hypothetical protein